jgi:hypothetical protein
MALQLEAVATAISGLTVTGLTVKDLNEIPEAFGMGGPTMFPNPDGFITDFNVQRVSFGMNTAKMTATYRLNYLLAYSPVGGTLKQFEAYARMVGLAIDIIDAILALASLNGAVTFEIPVIGEFGIVNDPAGNARWGCGVSVSITEFVN